MTSHQERALFRVLPLDEGAKTWIFQRPCEWPFPDERGAKHHLGTRTNFQASSPGTPLRGTLSPGWNDSGALCLPGSEAGSAVGSGNGSGIPTLPGPKDLPRLPPCLSKSFNPSSPDVSHTLNFYLQLRFVNRILLKRKVGESLDWGDCITAVEDKEPGGFEGQPEEVSTDTRILKSGTAGLACF
ncbi:uncharacterized protein LOC122895648 isoform X2 [Neovison vison]|uniref:uncharacterized protein LOC122895648 isoform X2 n=1 Tax=Neovison vison TaxID=452646 RepID=UPI001CF05BA2|nr:uncharacterized protein LOC122895648 isoform X2 [Neogale vison]